MSELPPYSQVGAPIPRPEPRRSMAGQIQTCSIQDQQYDYYRVTQNSPDSYQISLTIDSTPLYQIKISQDPSAVADIQLFTAFGDGATEAACRFTPRDPKGKLPKSGPIAKICAHEPLSDTAQWRPLYDFRSRLQLQDYEGSLPVVIVPGCRPIMRNFKWRVQKSFMNADVELWMKNPLPNAPQESLDRQALFAQYFARGTPTHEKGVLEMRRGGGLEFEFGILMSILAIMELEKRK